MQPATVVPAHRLGQLLAEARLNRGHDLTELVERSDGGFTIGELSDLEAGHRLLDDDLIRRVTELYELRCGPIIPQRAELTIDLDRHLVSAAGRAVILDDTSRDHILDRYLSLLYLLRNRRPGTRVPLREEDLAILAASLAERAELLEEQLFAAMAAENPSVNRLVGWFRGRLWVPGAGVLVGAVSVGTLVMVSSDDTASASDTTSLDVLGAANLARVAGPRVDAPSSTVEPSSADSTPAAAPRVPTEIATDIGEPATIVSDAAGSSTTTSSTSSTVATTSTSPTTTSVTTTSAPADPPPPGTPGELGAQAESLLPFDWRQSLPGWTVTYKGANPSFRGLTFPYDRTIEIYVRGDDTAASVAGILAHELGHAIDVTYFSHRERDRWQSARAIESTPWWPTAYASDFETGAGDFAEVFAYWALGDPSSSRIAGPPTAEQLAVLEDLVTPHL